MMNEKELPVYAALDRMGIEYTRIEHPAAATMEACAAIGEGTGASHCKNLFLTNRPVSYTHLTLPTILRV